MLRDPMTDAAHTSIREPQSVACLIRTFSRSLSAVDLAEPLASLDDNQPVALAALGLQSRREADRLTRDIEKLCNHLALAQELDAEHLAPAARLASYIHSILRAEGVQRIVALHCEMAAPERANSVKP